MTDFQMIYSFALVNIAIAAVLFVAISKKVESSMVDILVVLYEIFSTDSGGDVVQYRDGFLDEDGFPKIINSLDTDEDENLTDE